MTNPEQDRVVAVQRDITRVALESLTNRPFALAGSGAIREHGITQRPTEDVDLFTNRRDTEGFAAATADVIERLTEAGYEVDPTRQAPEFARLNVTSPTGTQTTVDLGVDWRQQEPVILEIGAVLSVTDAVGSKLAALYGRAAARDVLDVDSIRTSGHFTDAELLTTLAAREPGFDLQMFARQLQSSQRLRPPQVHAYGITAEQLSAIQDRCTSWAQTITDTPPPDHSRNPPNRDPSRIGYPLTDRANLGQEPAPDHLNPGEARSSDRSERPGQER